MKNTNLPLLRTLLLPTEISTFERTYLARITKVALGFLVLHAPALMLVAWLAGTSIARAGLFAAAIFVGPILAYAALDNPRYVARVYGFAAMAMGALLVHVGQGPMQIEMHFYFFVLIALLAVFADPIVIIVAAVTVVLHHLVAFLLAPRIVFNYEATAWSVVVHGLFVAFESAAACFVARSFFDNLVGLERRVDQRTDELEENGRQMALVLANVDQGLGIASRDGTLQAQTSRMLGLLLGDPTPGEKIWDWIGRRDAKTGAWMRAGWEMFQDGFLPVEVILEQLPRRMTTCDRALAFSYRPIGEGTDFHGLLFVATDVTLEVARERDEARHREARALFERVLKDRAAVEEFWVEAEQLVSNVEHPDTAFDDVKRLLHTIKGNAAGLGCEEFAQLCHRIEDSCVESTSIAREDIAELRARWNEVEARLSSLLGTASLRRTTLEVDIREIERAVESIRRGAPKGEILDLVRSWRLEQADLRLRRLAESAKRLAQRLEKEVTVEVDGGGIRLSPGRLRGLWSSLVHAVRNAADHGLEPVDERRKAGKSAAGKLTLRVRQDATEVRISIEDDGRGIAWERVRARAQAAGLPSATEQDLVKALFTDGLSTTTDVTEHSGRGVGLSAVRAEAEKLGGGVRVRSEAGRGTRMEIYVPRAVACDATDDPAEIAPLRASA